MSRERLLTECIMSGCYFKRYKDKYLCEMHWKERRKKEKTYKRKGVLKY